MTFIMKYPIKTDYLPKVTSGRRMGKKISKVKFVVLHDVGNNGTNNNGTTAKGNINYYKNSKTELASAHTFIDDQDILECIPAVTAAAEKAWHVIYNKPKDNQLFGADSNDAAIGVELCYYPKDVARSKAAYDKYVWYCAYLAYYFGLDPAKCFTGHEILDPGRKSDPTNGLKYIGKNLNSCIKDIQAEYKACTGTAPAKAATTTATAKVEAKAKEVIGTVTIKTATLNARKSDDSSSAVLRTITKGSVVDVYTAGAWGYETSNGWVSKKEEYVTFKAAVNYVGTVTVKTATLNVRASDDVNSKVIQVVKKGEAYKATKIGSWGYKIGNGWVSKGTDFVTFKKA